jgi:peptidyl-prolyl cis-trans isomerase D
MFKLIRQRAGGTLSVAIVGAIALVFIFWGVGGQDASNQASITLDDQKVSLSAFREIQRGALERLRPTFQGSPKELDVASYREAFGYLLERHNLLKLAKKFNLKVSDLELAKTIKSDPTFFENEAFSYTLYRDTVTRRFGQTLAAYENQVREAILVNLATDLLRGLARAPKAQTVEEFHFSADSISLNYAQFKSADYLAGLAPSDEELANYFAANQNKYLRPERVKIQYVEIPASRYVSGIEISPAEVEEAYSLAMDDLTTPETAEASHILVMFPNSENPSAEEKAATLEKANAILERAKTEDFATLAMEVSDDASSKENGGDLANVVRGETLPAFDQAIFEEGVQNIGKPIGPVETSMGYHIILVRSHSKASNKTLEEATPELTESLIQRKARTLAGDRIEELELASRYPATLAEGAKALGLEVIETDFFSQAEGAPDFIANQTEEAERAFRLEVGQLSFPANSAAGYVLYSPVEKSPAYIPALTDEGVLDQVKADWTDEKALSLAKEAATAFIEEVKSSDWAKAAAKLPPTVEKGQTPSFPRLSVFYAGAPVIYSDVAELLKNYVALAEPGQVGPTPVPLVTPVPFGYLAVGLASFEPADDKDLENGPNEAGGFDPKIASERLGNAFYAYWLFQANRETKINMPDEIRNLIEGTS